MIKLRIEIPDFDSVSTNRIKRVNFRSKRFHDAKGVGCKRKDLAIKLVKYKDQLEYFKHSFEPKLHYIKAEYYFFMPEEKLLTKKKVISKMSKDLDNHLKFIQDGLFKRIGLDDSLICQIETAKLPSWNKKYNVTIILTLESLSNLWISRAMYSHS